MKLYKIKDSNTGYYHRGGRCQNFSKRTEGKFYSSFQEIEITIQQWIKNYNHFAYDTNPSDMIIEEYDIKLTNEIGVDCETLQNKKF